MHGEYICVPDRRPYNKHLSTMAKLTCAGEDQDPAQAAIFETSSLFNTVRSELVNQGPFAKEFITDN